MNVSSNKISFVFLETYIITVIKWIHAFRVLYSFPYPMLIEIKVLLIWTIVSSIDIIIMYVY